MMSGFLPMGFPAAMPAFPQFTQPHPFMTASPFDMTRQGMPFTMPGTYMSPMYNFGPNTIDSVALEGQFDTPRKSRKFVKLSNCVSEEGLARLKKVEAKTEVQEVAAQKTNEDVEQLKADVRGLQMGADILNQHITAINHHIASLEYSLQEAMGLLHPKEGARVLGTGTKKKSRSKSKPAGGDLAPRKVHKKRSASAY
uniref:Uncharacterized protein n=1 Tax=Eutreptiella gymnastica TaxID=73025 RepID=A0A7S1IH58_9EUGL